MPGSWRYQINVLELGPVSPTELRRLLQEGRIAPHTPERREGQAEWIAAERAAVNGGVEPVDEANTRHASLTAPVANPWHLTLLDRYAAFGVPVGLGLLPWGRVAAFVCLLVLAPFAVALTRVLVDIAGHLEEMAGGRRQAGVLNPKPRGADARRLR